MSTAYDMVMSVKEMYGDQNGAARQIAMKKLMNIYMVERTSVRDHVLKTMNHLNTLEILGAEIDRETMLISCSSLCRSLLRNFA